MSHSPEEIFNHIQQVLVELFELDASAIKPEARLYDDLDIDSIDTVDLLIELKKFTGKEVSPEQFSEARTLGDIINIVSQDTLSNSA